MKVTAVGNSKNAIWEMLIGIGTETAVIWMFVVGFMLSLLSVFGIECDWTLILGGALASSCLCAVLGKWKYGTISAILVMVVAAFTISFFTGAYLINGFYHFYNMAAESLGRNTSILLSSFVLLSEESAFRDMEMFLGVVTAIVAVLSYGILKTGRFLLVVLWILPTLWSNCVDQNENPYAKVLMLAGTTGGILYLSYFGKKKKRLENGYRLVLMAGLMVFLLAGAGGWSANMVFPADEHETNAYLVDIKKQIVDYIEEIRFGKADKNTLPKGDLANAHIWEGTEDTVLKVTMSHPQSLYLRGFVGSIYGENQWKDLKRNAYYEEKDLFYWLDKMKFGGDIQLGHLRSLLKDTDLADAKITVGVENINADREFLYTPYELMSLDADVEENNGDSYQKSTKFFGTAVYSFETYGNLVKDFPQMAAEGYLYKASHDEDNYVEAESHYNVFVYNHYTELPAELNTYFKQQLGYAGDKEKGHVNYYSAIGKIRTYLEKHMTCGNYGEELPEGEDFAEYFLKESKIGNPVHFATAAALMFRYYGIPSRYVEGYLITPEDVEGLSGESTIGIAGTNGHAWVEIYVDGLGWVPVEMTPDYYEVMEEPDFTKGLEADSTVVVQEPEEEEEEPEVKEEGDLKYKLVGFFIDLAKILLTVLLVFDGFCILFFLYSLMRRFFGQCKTKESF